MSESIVSTPPPRPNAGPRLPTEWRGRCTNCGLIQPVRPDSACRECGHTRFTSG